MARAPGDEDLDEVESATARDFLKVIGAANTVALAVVMALLARNADKSALRTLLAIAVAELGVVLVAFFAFWAIYRTREQHHRLARFMTPGAAIPALLLGAVLFVAPLVLFEPGKDKDEDQLLLDRRYNAALNQATTLREGLRASNKAIADLSGEFGDPEENCESLLPVVLARLDEADDRLDVVEVDLAAYYSDGDMDGLSEIPQELAEIEQSLEDPGLDQVVSETCSLEIEILNNMLDQMMAG